MNKINQLTIMRLQPTDEATDTIENNLMNEEELELGTQQSTETFSKEKFQQTDTEKEDSVETNKEQNVIGSNKKNNLVNP